MRIKIWGTRGSAPVSSPQFQRYGGETSCVEVKTDSGDTIILDAGSGLTALNRYWKKPEKTPVICLSHMHLDHIQGLPFFSPLYNGDIILYGPKGASRQMERLFDGSFHPVKAEQLKINVRELESGEKFRIGDARIEVMATNHPGGCLAWKITADGATFVYGADHEIPLEEKAAQSSLYDFMEGSDVVLLDSHFTPEDHARHPGWGHSSPDQWAKALRSRHVGKIFFGHFNPAYSDGEIDELLAETRWRIRR